MAKSLRQRAGPDAEGLDANELESAVGFWLRLAQQQDQRAFNRLVARSGITPPLYAMMLVIAANPGLRQTDIGELLRIRQPNLVDPIDTLIGRGLITRRPDPNDRRAQAIDLTDAGRRLLADMRAAHDSMIGGYRDRLGAERYSQLVELLAAFVGRLPTDPPGR